MLQGRYSETSFLRPPLLCQKIGLKKGDLSSEVEFKTFILGFTQSCGLSRGGGLLLRWPLKRGSTVIDNSNISD